MAAINKRILLSTAALPLLLIASGAYAYPAGYPQASISDETAFSNLFGISPDGFYIYGRIGSNAVYANASGDQTNIGAPSMGTFPAITSITDDNSTFTVNAVVGGIYHAYTYDGTYHELIGLGGATQANDISGDGRVVVGESNNGSNHGVYWITGTSGAVQLDALSGDTSSAAYSVSADGNHIAGNSRGSGLNHGVVWLGSTTPLALQLTGGYAESDAYVISRDGSTVVGDVADLGYGIYKAVKWNSATQTGTLLGELPSGPENSYAFGVSHDGRVIVGDTDTTVFRYTDATGMKDLNILLADAGVTMGSLHLTDSEGISDDGVYISASGGGNSFIVFYDDGMGGVTTLDSVHQSIQQLGDQQLSQLAQEHNTASLLLANNSAISNSSFTYMGGMFGSAVGYFGGQYARGDNSLRGGFAFGHQDDTAVEQDNSTTVALAARHIFASDSAVKPYAELGGWATPDEDLTLSRNYANGAGIATGKGTTSAYSWAGYAQAGVIWQAREGTQIRGFGELGQQVLNYDGYTEAAGAGNPFPATIASGQLRYDVTRFGGALSQSITGGPLPLTATASAAIAHAFNVSSDLSATVGGVGTTQAASSAATWGEFGFQLDAQINERWTASAGLIATSGDAQMDSKLHGTVGLSYKF